MSQPPFALHAVHAGHDQVLERGGDLVRRQSFLKATFFRLQNTRLLDHLCELLHKQRHAAGAVVDLLDHSVGERFSRLASHQVANLTSRQPRQCQAGLVRDRRPGRLELGAEGEHCQYSIVEALGEELAQKLQSGRIDPVQVLNDKQDRPSLGAHVQPLQHRLERFLPLPDG